MKRITYVYTIIVGLLALSIFIPPIMGFFNDRESAFLHSLFLPFCHQYVYRSFCMEADFPYITNCLNINEKAEAYTFNYDKIIVKNITFSKKDVGIIRAYKIKTNKIKYVFPVCVRDMGFYIGLFLGVFIFLLIPKKEINIFVYVILIFPFLFDGLLQLIISSYESTNTIRLVTGLIAGIATSFVIIKGLERRF